METAFVALSALRNAIVSEALTWEDTPYQHRQRCRGAGADCVGFPLGVCLNLGLLPDTIEIPYYSVQWHLHQRRELLIETALGLGCREKTRDELLPGDMILFKIGLVCSHTGILVTPETFMHACCPMPSKIMQRPFDRAWKEKLAKRFFAFPGVDD
jgi:cell wall-associated NlpC family hydrolase